MNFYVNEILKNTSTSEKYRILWIDQNLLFLFMIQLDNDKALPVKQNISEIREAIILNEWVKELDESLAFRQLTEEYEQKYLTLRDSAWSIIKNLVDKEPAIYDKKYRSDCVKDACKKYSVTYPTVRKYLYKYWSRGKNINALLPDYSNSGAKGKERVAGEKKRGRPRSYGGEGINIDEVTRKIFRQAIEKYYLTSKENSLTVAFNFMLREFYAENIYYENGIEKVIIKNDDELPTMDQFRYWFHQEYDAPEILKARKGEKRFNKDHRAVLGTSLSEVFGPGSRYQIDATVGDIYLVSEVNRNWIIGRPVIYIVVDVFSRMVVGMYIGLEGPSWLGASMAIRNVVSDKKAYCAEYGIEISEEEWPSKHLPEILLADKGEFEGYNVNRLINAFNLHVENAASYRADWKGIVESKFKTIQAKVKPLLPGYINIDFQERGGSDYRLDAVLSIREFNQIMIKQILSYNTKKFMDSYVRDRDLVADNVLSIPLELWKWGIQNRTGKLKYFSEELVSLNLLPRGTATVNYKGIHFKGISYSCEKALKNSWFENARMKGSWKIELIYDPRNMDHVYIIDEQTNQLEKCYMTDASKRLSGVSLDEINYWRAEEKKISNNQSFKQRQKDIDFYSEVEAIVEKAAKESKQQKDPSLSKKEKVGLIREKRQLEKKYLSNIDSPPPLDKDSMEDKVISLKAKIEKDDFKRTDVREFLKRRKEKYDE